MQLLFKRSQNFNPPVKFKLWAKVEVSEEEQKLISQYNLSQAVLIRADQPGLMRLSFIIGFLIFVIVWSFFLFGLHYKLGIYIRVNALPAAVLGLISGLLGAVAAYTQMRETIYVKDLLYGRHFKCKSVIELARKEAYLQNITAFFQQVVQSAKHWTGTEAFEIETLPPNEAKQYILRGPLI